MSEMNKESPKHITTVTITEKKLLSPLFPGIDALF